MRIIAGEARGRRITVPPGDDIRPTSDRVREALFSMLSPRLQGARFLDLFAGSGANGLEAMSRGASRAVLVDNDRKSLAVIRQNVASTRLTGDIRCLQVVLPGGLTQVGGPFDIIFADPPYAFEHYDALLRALSDPSILAEEGVIYLEHARTTALPEAVGGLERTRERRYGLTVLSAYAWASPLS